MFISYFISSGHRLAVFLGKIVRCEKRRKSRYRWLKVGMTIIDKPQRVEMTEQSQNSENCSHHKLMQKWKWAWCVAVKTICDKIRAFSWHSNHEEWQRWNDKCVLASRYNLTLVWVWCPGKKARDGKMGRNGWGPHEVNGSLSKACTSLSRVDLCPITDDLCHCNTPNKLLFSSPPHPQRPPTPFTVPSHFSISLNDPRASSRWRLMPSLSRS